jgi:cytochrome b6
VTLGTVSTVLFLVQCGTGTLLALYYQPSLDGAHASVALIAKELRYGWLIRSLHVWGMTLLLVAILAHLLVTFLRGTYRSPREFVWGSGAILFLVLCAGAFTGQFLPLDQEAWQGAVIAGSSAGPLKPLVYGGEGITDSTVTRFFAAHAIALPALALLLMAAHVALVGRHRLAGAPEATASDPTFLERVTIATLAALGLLVLLAVAYPAGIGPKADPTTSVATVKPTWIFLPLYQAMHYGQEGVLLYVVLPAFVLLPFLDRGKSRALALGIGLIVIAAVAALGLLGAFA